MFIVEVEEIYFERSQYVCMYVCMYVYIYICLYMCHVKSTLGCCSKPLAWKTTRLVVTEHLTMCM